MVSLGMVDGKNLRKRFKTKSEAQDFCNAERASKKVDKTMPEGADGFLVRKWIALDQKLTKAGVDDLLVVGNRALKDLKAVQKTGSARECFDACCESHDGNRREAYLNDLRNRCGRFMRYFGEERSMLEITPETIEAYLNTLKNPGDFKSISAWLGWAVKKRWLSRNPCTGLKPEQSHGKVVTLSTDDAARILNAAVLSEQWDVLAVVAISLFAGLRPEEFRKVTKGKPSAILVWEDFHDTHLSVSPELCKNGRRSGKGRTILIEPVLRGWIELIRQKNGGVLRGQIQPNNWKKIWKSWRNDYWVDKDKVPHIWAKDQLRHSFGSYHLARSKNPAETAFIMENSPKVLKKYYWNWETLGPQAEIYWSLTPCKAIISAGRRKKT